MEAFVVYNEEKNKHLDSSQNLNFIVRIYFLNQVIFYTYAADRHGITVTRALLGHSNHAHSNTTEVYMHLIPSKFRVLMNAHPYQTTVRRRKPFLIPSL